MVCAIRFDSIRFDQLIRLIGWLISGHMPVNRLYLDNTYCHPTLTHPTREAAAKQVIELISKVRCYSEKARFVLDRSPRKNGR